MGVLVLGVGYIGSKLVSDLLAVGEEVVAVDNFYSTDVAAVERLIQHPRCRLIKGNAGNPGILGSAFKQAPISTVYLLAAQSSAHPGAASPRFTEVSNLLVPRVVLDAMRRHGAETIVFGSSLRIYGEVVHPDTGEDAPYGVCRDLSHLSKCYVEKLLEMYSAIYGLRCLSARLGIVYGLAPVVKTDFRFMTAPNKFCMQIARGEPLALYGGAEDETGFVHIADASRAMRAMAADSRLAGYTAINTATEWTSASNVAALAKATALRRGLSCTPAEPRATILATGRRLSDCGFSARLCLREGLGEMLDYFVGSIRSPETVKL